MVVAQASTSPQGVRSFGSRSHLPCLHSKGFGDSYGSSGFGSWRDAFGPRSGAASADEGGNCRRGFRRSQGADEDRRSNAEQSFLLHGTTCRGGSVEEDWESSREEGTGFPRRSGWTEEDVGDGFRRKSCARPCCNRKGDEDARECGRRSGAESTGFVRGGLARQVGPKGPGQVPGDLKKAPKFSSAYIKKGNKMVPRDVNYDYVKMYVQRIDRTVKRGRNKGIMSNSASDDKQLLNDFVYYLAQADQELRLRLDKATRTGQGECSCCRRRNNAKVPNFNGNTNNTSVEEDEEEW